MSNSGKGEAQLTRVGEMMQRSAGDPARLGITGTFHQGKPQRNVDARHVGLHLANTAGTFVAHG